jgi:hypothetical protein
MLDLDDAEKRELFWEDIEGTFGRAVFQLERAGRANVSEISDDHADHRDCLKMALNRLRPSYDNLAWLLEPLREKHENELKSICQMILMMMESSMIIGSSIIWSPTAMDIFKLARGRDQATIAQVANSKNAKARKS